MISRTGKFLSIALSTAILFTCSGATFASAEENANLYRYQKNASGETYGNNLQAKRLGYEAELVLAVGEDGTTGYVRTSDLNGETPSSPEEAYTLQEERIEKGDTERYIPLYKNDGETIIGRFKVDFNPEEKTDTGITFRSRIPSDGYSYSETYGAIDTPGYSYYVFNGIKNATLGVRGKTRIETQNKAAAPISYMGVKVRIFREKDGAIVRETDWYYNSTATPYFEKDAYYGTVSGNHFYSNGLTREWNREISQYWTHVSTRSPNNPD